MSDAELRQSLKQLRALRRSVETRTFDTLVLVYGMACPLKCDFCCHPVEDYGAVKIPRAEAIDLIHQAAELPSFKLLAFTGGEPFVYLKDIKPIMAEVCHYGFDIRIVTAAHWATSYERAIAQLEPLVDLGLSQLSVSTDPSHQKFVPRANAENAMNAALDLGLVAEFASVVWDPELEMDDFVTVPEQAGRVFHLAAPIGRAKRRTITREMYAYDEPIELKPCGKTRRHYDITVYPDGEVYPCCSGGFNRDAKLSFGNVREDSIATIVERMKADAYTRIALGTGLKSIYEVAQHRFPEIYAQLPDYSKHVSVCQTCVDLHSDPALLETLAPVIEYVDRLAEVLDELEQGAPPTSPTVPNA